MEHMAAIGTDDPHVVCVAPKYKTGRYYIIIAKEVCIPVPNAIHAIDIWVKSFKVFGIPVPYSLSMIIDFIDCVLYKVLTHSSRVTVNRLVAAFREATNAEDIDVI